MRFVGAADAGSRGGREEGGPEVVITVEKKGSKSHTKIVGLDLFDVNEKNFAKTLGKKFSTSASYNKGEGIVMNGGWSDQMKELILESFPEQVVEANIKTVNVQIKRPVPE